MAKKGLVFLMNIKPSTMDGFLLIKRYRFIPDFTDAHKTIIELEIYPNNICVVSFYPHNKGTKKNKYKIRLRYKPGHIKAILRASIEAFFKLGKHEYAFIFSAADDIIGHTDYNSRYSAYLLFLENNYADYNVCYKVGSMRLNTYMVYHPDYKYKEEANTFFEKFDERVLGEMHSSEEESK